MDGTFEVFVFVRLFYNLGGVRGVCVAKFCNKV